MLTSARQFVREASERLEDAGVPEPAASAEVLLAELLGVRRGELASYPGPLSEEEEVLYEAWISRRLEREPVQRILGYAYFRTLQLELDEYVLIPRPDTESVVDAALEAADRKGGSCRVLDIGTGSGAIAISIAQERPSCDVHAIDISEGALQIARCNATRAGVTVRFHHADLHPGLDVLEGSVELLVSNQRIFAEAAPLLVDGADVVLEVGDGQAEEVLEIGRRAGYMPLGNYPDLAGTPRAVLLRWGSA